jgi:plastocyanin
MKYLLAAGSALLGAAAVLGSSAQPAATATQTVGVADNEYQPAAITITAGDTVEWDWTGTAPHSVTADDNSFDSGELTGTQQAFSRVFSAAGTYGYYCTVHGAALMSGTITVQEAATPTATNTSGATNTPGTPSATAERSDTPVPTGTAEPTFTTQTTATPQPVDAAPIAATAPGGGAGDASTLPTSGDGGDAGGASAMPIVLGIAGGLMIAVAVGGRALRR